MCIYIVPSHVCVWKSWIKTTLSSYFTQFHILLFKHTKTCHNTSPVSDNPRGLKTPRGITLTPTWGRRKGGGCTNRCPVCLFFYEGNKSFLCDTRHTIYLSDQQQYLWFVFYDKLDKSHVCPVQPMFCLLEKHFTLSISECLQLMIIQVTTQTVLRISFKN